MPPVLHLGPLAFPMPVLWLLASAGAGLAVGSWMGRRGEADVQTPLLLVLLMALLCARLAFVWPYRSAYLAAPLSVLDIRDGGWQPEAGFIAAWLTTLALLRRRPGLRWPLLGGVGCASALWFAGTLALLVSAPKAEGLPTVELSRLDGTSVTLAGQAGRPVVLNLWATWCAPCRREMPVLAQAQQDHPQVQFVFLNQGESADVVQRYLRASQLDLQQVLLDRKALVGAPHGGMLPTTLFFDARGRLVSVRTGELSAASLQQRLALLQ